MAALTRCLACGHSPLINDAWFEGNGARSYVGRSEHPERLFAKNTRSTVVEVQVCGKCGFLHFFAQNPSVLDFTPKE
jgi:hypothetical protein